MKTKEIDAIIENALREDFPCGDITSESIIPSGSVSEAVILAKEKGVLAGVDIARRVFELVDPSLNFEKRFEDGKDFSEGDIIAILEGDSISMLKGERTALNFLQRMSGIATKTRTFTQALKGKKTKILDTRKTTPGMRVLEKYAVRMGGGENHRLNLSEMVMIKDNHLRLLSSITEAVQRARENVKDEVKIEVEVNTLEGVKEALQAGADIIMLDNMKLEEMREAAEWVDGRVLLEVSGNVDLENVKELSSIGIDYISVGSLTHSYKSVDMSIEFKG